MEEAGLSTKQAEAQTRVYMKVLNMVVEDQLATKADIEKLDRRIEREVFGIKEELHNVKDGLKDQIGEVNLGLQNQVRFLETEIHKEIKTLTKWLAALALGTGSLIVGAITLLVKLF